MARSIATYGNIDDDGKLILLKRDEFTEAVKHFGKGPIKLELCRWGPVRTDPQNAWYWGIIIPMITDAINDQQGEEIFGRDEVHEFLKAKFNTKRVIGEGEQEIRIAQSTSKLSTVEFSAYIEDVRNWAAEMLDISIPDPDKAFTAPRKRKKQDDNIFIQDGYETTS